MRWVFLIRRRRGSAAAVFVATKPGIWSPNMWFLCLNLTRAMSQHKTKNQNVNTCKVCIFWADFCQHLFWRVGWTFKALLAVTKWHRHKMAYIYAVGTHCSSHLIWFHQRDKTSPSRREDCNSQLLEALLGMCSIADWSCIMSRRACKLSRWERSFSILYLWY